MKNWKHTVMILIVLAMVMIPAAVFADGETLPEHIYDDKEQAIEATQNTHETAYYYKETGQEIEGKCGDNTTYKVYGRIEWEQDTYNGQLIWDYFDTQALVISGTGPTYDYTWETRIDKFDLVWEVIFEEGVTKIGNNFFNMQDSWIRKVTLPEGLTSIGESI